MAAAIWHSARRCRILDSLSHSWMQTLRVTSARRNRLPGRWLFIIFHPSFPIASRTCTAAYLTTRVRVLAVGAALSRGGSHEAGRAHDGGMAIAMIAVLAPPSFSSATSTG